VEMEVFDIRGHRLLEENLGVLPAGQHGWNWQGLDHQQHRVASGIYLVRMKIDGLSAGQSQRIMLLK